MKYVWMFLLCFGCLAADCIPVVTVEENDRLEELDDGTGVNEWRFMSNSGAAVALEAEKMLNFNTNSKVILLAGKGYKGGNALWGGYLLLQKGYNVEAYLLSPVEQCAPVCQKIITMLKEAGGKVELFNPALNSNTQLIIDGLVGSGFKGGAKGALAEAILWANQSKKPILAVDIPSGMNGNTGEVKTVAIEAKQTLAICYPKIGFFVGQGSKHVGCYSVTDIGVDEKIKAEVAPVAYITCAEKATSYLKQGNAFVSTRELMAGLAPDLTFDAFQAFAEERQQPLLLIDSPRLMFIPAEIPLIIEDCISQYKISEVNEIYEVGL